MNEATLVHTELQRQLIEFLPSDGSKVLVSDWVGANPLMLPDSPDRQSMIDKADAMHTLVERGLVERGLVERVFTASSAEQTIYLSSLGVRARQQLNTSDALPRQLSVEQLVALLRDLPPFDADASCRHALAGTWEVPDGFESGYESGFNNAVEIVGVWLREAIARSDLGR